MRTDIYGRNGYIGCIDEQGYVYRMSRNEMMSNSNCIGKIDSNGNVYRQSKGQMTSNSNIVGTWTANGAIYSAGGNTMLSSGNYVGSFDSNGYVYENGPTEFTNSTNQVGYVAGNYPYGAAALLLLLQPSHGRNGSYNNNAYRSNANQNKAQRQRQNQQRRQNQNANGGSNLGFDIMFILVLIGIAAVASLFSTLLLIFTAIPYIAFIVFLVLGGIAMNKVSSRGLNRKLSEEENKLVWQWIGFATVIIVILTVGQCIINPAYIAYGIVGVFFSMMTTYLYYSAKCKLGELNAVPKFGGINTRAGGNRTTNKSYNRAANKTTNRTASYMNNKQTKNQKHREAATEKYIKLECNNCGQKVRIPANRGRLRVTCPKCGNTSDLDS